jgi:hypothetical protein
MKANILKMSKLVFKNLNCEILIIIFCFANWAIYFRSEEVQQQRFSREYLGDQLVN